MGYYRFVYDDKVLFESKDESEWDKFVDQWLEDNFDALYEFSNGMLMEENVEEYQTWFKEEHFEEVE